MPIDVKFSFVCRRRFAQLPGAAKDVRHCSDCNLNVTNLDAMDEEAAHNFLHQAAGRGERVCVSATVKQSGVRKCKRPAQIRPTAGSVVPGLLIYIDVNADKSLSSEQFALLMQLTGLPNRLAVAQAARPSSMIRLGPCNRWSFATHVTAPLDRAGLTWSKIELPWNAERLDAIGVV